MPIITALKPQKNKKRVNVYLDGKFSFGIDLDNLVKFRLKVEKQISENKVNEIVKEAELQKVFGKLIRFATLRPRSKREITTWFKKHKIYKGIQDVLINKLKRLKLIDDQKFAQWWVEQRMSFRPKSLRVLKLELREKGIDRSAIEDALSEVNIDEDKIAKELLEKKKYRWEKLPKLERKKKMSEFLARRGFGWSVIKEIVRNNQN